MLTTRRIRRVNNTRKFGRNIPDAPIPNTTIHKYMKRFQAGTIQDRKKTIRRRSKWGKTKRNWCWIGEVSKRIFGSTCRAKGHVCAISKNRNKTAAFISMQFTNSTTHLKDRVNVFSKTVQQMAACF
jgi:hypothetical protein